MAGDDDLDERAARLLARSEGLRERTIRRRQALDWAEKATAEVEGAAASADGLVRATVDETGVLTRLELDPKTQGVPPGELARVITTVVRQAAANAREKVRATYDGLRDEGLIKDLPPNVLPAPDVGPAQVTVGAVPQGRRPSRPAGAEPTEEGERSIMRPAMDENWPDSSQEPAPSPPAKAESPPPREVPKTRQSREEEGPPETWMRREDW